jgi:hypothetical protein
MPADRMSAKDKLRCLARAALIASAALTLVPSAAPAQDSALVAGSYIRIQGADEKQVHGLRRRRVDRLSTSQPALGSGVSAGAECESADRPDAVVRLPSV